MDKFTVIADDYDISITDSYKNRYKNVLTSIMPYTILRLYRDNKYIFRISALTKYHSNMYIGDLRSRGCNTAISILIRDLKTDMPIGFLSAEFELDFEIESEEKVISDDGKYEEAAQAEISTEEEPTDEIEETIEEVESEYEEETEDKVEEENEEELRREAEKNTADDFDEGYDFFEEKPRRIVGIIDVDSSDLKNAVDYDVLSEEEKRAVEVETAVDNDKTESFIAAAEKAGNGIKNFFVHCGYFCTNVSRLIKRKHAAKKRKKAELERRERERVRKQQAAQRRDGNGLVKVHSATQRRPRPNGRASQSAHRTPNRKPQQNNNRRK